MSSRPPARVSSALVLALQATLLIVTVALWEWTGRGGGMFASPPSAIAIRLADWASHDLWRHVAITLLEIVAGLGIGGITGIVAGLLLGRTIVIGTVLRPLIVALYSVPIVTLAPLLILWFGLDLAPKIVLVAVSTYFLVFFNTFAGVRAIDRDLVLSLRLMGATSGEEFRKVSAPGAATWIVSGIKIAVPYSFAAAVTGELLAARDGVGSLLSKAAAQFDMTGLYAALVVLLVLGVAASAGVNALERRLLRWRHRE